MAVQDVLTVFAILALGSNVMIFGLVVAWVMRNRPSMVSFGDHLRVWAPRLAGATAVVATVGSLYLSEVADLVPCRWCWFQRVAMYPLALLLPVGIVTGDRGVRRYALPMSMIGLVISIWHYLLQNFPSLEDADSCNILNPCTFKYAWKFGFVSVPYMAGSGFLLIMLLLLSSRASPVKRVDID
jgi:disulfide bond formation protein DsbB